MIADQPLCPICEKEIDTWINVVIHMGIVHGKLCGSPLRCPCGEYYGGKSLAKATTDFAIHLMSQADVVVHVALARVSRKKKNQPWWDIQSFGALGELTNVS
jgi:hypothetical protein